jgi:signal transduction histidine kinase
MSSVDRAVAVPSDPKARIVSIFVGAVLLPSIALSVLSFFAVPKLAENTKTSLLKRADHLLSYVEMDLEAKARSKALDVAREVGPEALLDGRPAVVRVALERVGFDGDMFDSLHLEGSSPVAKLKLVLGRPSRDDFRDLHEAIRGPEPAPGPEDTVPIGAEDGSSAGVLRFSFACSYAHGTLVREYFDKDFPNPDQALVVRVSEPDGDVLYETAPTQGEKFEVARVMTSASFRGIKLQLRYKDRSIEDEVHHLAIAKSFLIAFIDLMLGAGLLLVYTNVRREIRLSRLKSDFVANVSHELKTPLALIRLFAETLELGRVQSEDKARQYYRVINKESQRLTQLINNILDFSRIEAGRKEYRFAPADLGRIVYDVLESYRFPIEQQGFALETDVAEDLPEIEVDKEALSQALINLLNNAIKYSGEEKYLKVSVLAHPDRISVAVVDHGIGIGKADQQKIFEKFYRAENSLVHETKGSGLGLSLVRHIMEAHGGSVEVESGPGKGSTFTLVLPLKRDRTAADATT